MRSAGGPSRSISSTIPSSVFCALARSRSMPRVVNAVFTALRSREWSGLSTKFIALACGMKCGASRVTSRPITSARLNRGRW